MTDHTVEVYDDYSKKWSRVPPMRSKRVGAAAMVVGDHLYVVGGYRVHPDQPLGCVEVYDPWLNRWKRLKSSMCIPRFGHSLALVDDRYLYAIGGDSQRQLVSEVEVFDTQIGRWLQQPELKICLPRPLAGGRVIEKDGLLYIVGGDVGSSPLQFSDLIYVLDTTVTPHVWSVLSTRLKVGRSACAVAWLDESKSAIGVFGGYVVIDGDFKEVATSEVIPLEGTHVVPLHEAPILGRVMPVDAHAKEIPEMPSTRAGCRAVTVGCRVILVGGENPIPANAAEITDSGSDSVSSPGSDRSTESSDILAEFVNNSNSAAADRSSIFVPLEGASDDSILDAPSTPSRSQDSSTRPASIDEAVTRAMQRYFTLVHSTRPNSDSGTQRERDAAAQLLQEITRALRVQAVHARRLSEPVRVVHDKPLVFDSSKWCWVDEQALFAGRTAAAISVGSVFPVSYGCEPRRNSGGLRHSCKRSRVECTPSASARRRGKTGCSLRGCLHFEVPCEVNMAAERVDNGKVAAPIPLGMPVIEECPLMIGVRLLGSEVVHVIVSPGTRLPVDNKLLKLTTSRDHQSVATVQLVVSGGRTALSACRDFMSLTRELDTSTNHYQGLVQLDLYLSISVFAEVTAVLDELTDFRGINNGIAQAAGDGGSISDLPYQLCLIGTASCCYGRSRQESVSSSFTSISTDKTGCAVWECGIILAYCLCQAFLLRGKSSALKLPIGPDTENYGVELGCGTGLVSLALASLGAKMVATDGNDQVLKLAERNLDQNEIPKDRISSHKLIHSKRPPSEAQRVEKLISSTLEGVGSVMNETLLVGKILAQAAGQEANAAVHDATDSIQKRFEEYLSSPQAFEQLGEKRIELIREQVKASRKLLETAAVFLRSTSESSLESSIEVLNKSLTLMEVPIAILGPQAKRDREIQDRILTTLSSRSSPGTGSSTAWSQSDPRKLIQFVRHISQQRQERLSEYVDALLASGQLTKHPLVPHEFEKKLYLDILSIVTFAFENAMGSLDNMQLWGHAIKVRSVQESEVFINLKLSGTSLHGREQLSVIVDSMLRDEFVNNPLIPDAVERSLYLNTVILIFRILEDLSNSLHVSVMGHRLEWKLSESASATIRLWNDCRCDYYKSLAQVPTKELQERLYELQNEHEMIGKVLANRTQQASSELPTSGGSFQEDDLKKVEYGKGKFALRAAEHPHVARCLEVKGSQKLLVTKCPIHAYIKHIILKARVKSDAKATARAFQCDVGFGIKHGGPTISDVVTYNVTLKPPDDKTAAIVAASEPFSYCECLVYDWGFERRGRLTKVTVNVYFKAK
ncbi:hypothetical protein Pmar_PMAR018947 [Perkinsus marinus ATCC 50983]|uniref:Kelch repeat protein n=1 Tax=Perkinsus marinus (strain ATCC 50983 / TXsc) TaxID=423536 RepID=C5K9Y3_PERM5|nr:hypothetical protein Pmar_PMAR018947 [Perkinsus marinus ATCC 50983]EER18712.1 hypothetical protein Pmar_PMAR018947 [Perkinsus marinus ATCC 50983]|eukprot:XP_002786916.1 hypothetical protein Pmar_PMAR018947 [Perkinsus marinus ATCC 50983]